ncbi:lipoprotein LpqV [Rhodococcus globerulus]|uniref:Lipoprotein LpqV n=1 Tax=Rhodococcus globerulus TaxID=33008 RepID=A0ABU4BS98_RHOGO|nr:lipoprotein LpqV [Rhodococcus globerulus]MDV6267096.1 lipoprotein LpqV [Rhodococcus globerulus]
MTTPPPSIETDPSSAWQDGYDLGLEHGEQMVEKPSRGLWMLAGAGIVIAVQIVIAAIGFAIFALAHTSEDVALDVSATPTHMTIPANATTTPRAAASIYGVTPDGLTTSVNAPITASAAEMRLGCADIKAWAAATGITDAEAILALTQMTAEDSTENFTVTEGGLIWADQSPSNQAALIAMINAAANGEC